MFELYSSRRREAGPLAYIVPSRIPSRVANSFQVMKMAEALAGAVPRMLLVAQEGGQAVDVPALQRQYGIDRVPEMRLLDAAAGIHLFNLRAALIAKRQRASLVLSRSVGAAAISARLSIPAIWECHAPPAGFELRYWRALVGSKYLRRVVVISDALRRIMLDRLPEARHLDILVAHDGVDAHRFSGLPVAQAAKLQQGRNPGRLIAGYAGHLYPGRGIEVILNVARHLAHWDFLIIGGNDADVEALRQKIQSLSLTNVSVIGFVPNSELPGTLAMCDVLLMPYQRKVLVSGQRVDTAAWMSPLKLFEYLAMKRAIVASDLKVLREVLNDNVAIMVAPDQVDDWTQALRTLEDPEPRRRLAHAASELAAEYSWRQRVRRMLDLSPAVGVA